MTDKEKQGSWEPSITDFHDFGNRSAHACHIQPSFRIGPDQGGEGTKERQTDGHRDRKRGSGGLGSLRGETTGPQKPGVSVV